MTQDQNTELAEQTWRDMEIAADATGALKCSRLTLPVEKVRALVAERRALASLPSQKGRDDLDEIRRRARNIWGAISSNQTIDKDVEGQAKALLDYIDRLRALPTPSVDPAETGVVEALTAAKDFIAMEYADSRQEQYGEWLAPEARKVFGLICEALAALASRPHARPIDEAIVEALEMARHELWEIGASESEHNALWHIRAALASIATSEDVGKVEAAMVAAWNACRKSIYAVCEDVRDQADKTKAAAYDDGTSDYVRGHIDGYHSASCYTAKSIARGFNSMEALDDDNLTAALASIAPQGGGGER